MYIDDILLLRHCQDGELVLVHIISDTLPPLLSLRGALAPKQSPHPTLSLRGSSSPEAISTPHAVFARQLCCRGNLVG